MGRSIGRVLSLAASVSQAGREVWGYCNEIKSEAFGRSCDTSWPDQGRHMVGWSKYHALLYVYV